MQILLTTIQSIAGVDKISLLITVITFMALLFGWVINRLSLLRIRHNSERSKDLSTIMQRTLSSSNNYVVRLALQQHYGVNMYGNFLPEEGIAASNCAIAINHRV